MTYETCMFVQDLRETVAPTHALIRAWATGRMTRDDLVRHVDYARTTTGDSMTDLIAVNLCCTLVAALGIVPNRDVMHTFTVLAAHTGNQVDPDAAPAGLAARSRIVVALANADAGAARDVYVTFRNTHPDQITAFIADTVEVVHEVATRHGMRLDCPHCG